MDEDQVSFQCEKNAVVSDAQAKLTRLPSQFLHVALQIKQEHVESLANPAPLLPGKRTQLGQRLNADLDPVDHALIMVGRHGLENIPVDLKSGRSGQCQRSETVAA